MYRFNPSLKFRMRSLDVIAITLAVAGVLFGACYPDTGTTLCDSGTGLSCPPGFSCSQDRKSCIPGNCGNGKPEMEIGEECDDGNTIDGDRCDSNCTWSRCGNGIVVAGVEECDDRNNEDGDGCDRDCTKTSCGNGITTPLEECDDGSMNLDSGSCLSNCRTAKCGDGKTWLKNEQCDNGQMNSNDGECLANCALAGCGDGYIRTGVEKCDDGNASECGSCGSDCKTSYERAVGFIFTIPQGNLIMNDPSKPTENRDRFVLHDRSTEVTFRYTAVDSSLSTLSEIWVKLGLGENANAVAKKTVAAINGHGYLQLTASLYGDEMTTNIIKITHDRIGSVSNSAVSLAAEVDDDNFVIWGMIGGAGSLCPANVSCMSDADCDGKCVKMATATLGMCE
jgi:cysteine-rich repeat protein